LDRAGTLEGRSPEAAIDRFASFGAAPALITLRGTRLEAISYAVLAEKVRSLAAGFAAHRIGSEAVVALIAPNSFDWVIARLALAAVGAVAVALDDLATEAELAALVRDCGCRHALTSTQHAPMIRAVDPAIALWVMGEGPAPEGTRHWRELFLAPSASSLIGCFEGPALFTYTSGTTGPPKGFLLSYANLAANLVPLTEAGLVGKGDRVLLPLPLHHIYPLLVGLLTPLSAGAAVVFPEAIAGPQLVQAIRLADVSAIVGVPRLYAALASGLEAQIAARGPLVHGLFHIAIAATIELRRRFGFDAGRWVFRPLRARLGPKLRLLVSGGAHLDAETLWPLVGMGFEVRSGYGLAETASIFTGNLPSAERLESEGKPFQGGLMRIAAPDEDGVGEIELQGANICASYRNPEHDRDAFTDDGWFRTGDLGRIDRKGFLYVTGRCKETIVLGGGKKINPETLEHIYGSSPYIREIAVLERQGSLVALVVPQFETAQAGPSVRFDATIRVALASQSRFLPSYERLAGFALSSEPLPRTRLGKYRRFLLPALYERALMGQAAPLLRAPSPEDEALLANAPARRLYDILLARYKGRVSLDANPQLDLGIDSLEWIALSLALEQAGLRVPERAFADCRTVRDLLRSAEAPGEMIAPEPRDIDEDWLGPSGAALTALGFALYLINRILVRVLFRLRIQGAEHLPAAGPYMLAANHASDLDALVIMAALDYRRARRLYWAGDAVRLFRRRWLNPLWRALHVFPADDRFPGKVLAAGEAVLARGNDLAWFPEGWRTPDGRIQRFHPGIGRILARTRVPVLPIHISGTFEVWPRYRRLPRLGPVGVSIGQPVQVDSLLRAISGETQEQRIADGLRDAIAALEAPATASPMSRAQRLDRGAP
jgi:long-chain acyl-CoA synthetase